MSFCSVVSMEHQPFRVRVFSMCIGEKMSMMVSSLVFPVSLLVLCWTAAQED
uniref:Uncharacterized protein n=1 Tax=Arundo donax TaxID=35708 RepID=A0A0A9FWB9_ARUDO